MIDEAARLSAVDIPASDREELAGDFRRILEWVEVVTRASSDEVPAAPDLQAMRLARDEPERSLDTEDLAARAPRFEGGMFVVPRVLGEP